MPLITPRPVLGSRTMNGDIHTSPFESALIELAERHDAAEWQLTDAGENVLAIPLGELSKDPGVELDWRSQALPGTTAVQLFGDPAAAEGDITRLGQSIAIPGDSGPAGGSYDAAATIEIGDQRWTLYVATSVPHVRGKGRLPEAPFPREVEDLDAREDWFRKRH